MVSDAHEGDVGHLPARDAVAVLARRKGDAVAARLGDGGGLVLACDSLLEYGGESWGKASSVDEVITRWRAMRGGTGLLHTGHYLTDASTGRAESETDTALIRFGQPTDSEIAVYASTEESRQVAGPFTLEGRSAPWVESIDGNYGTVTGVSLVVLRRLLGRLGIGITELWQ